MKTRVYAIGFACLCAGLLGGYLLNTSPNKQQVKLYSDYSDNVMYDRQEIENKVGIIRSYAKNALQEEGSRERRLKFIIETTEELDVQLKLMVGKKTNTDSLFFGIK